MAAHKTLALAFAPGANNEDLFSCSARDLSHTRDSDVARTSRTARTTEGNGPETHPAKLAQSGAAGTGTTDTDTTGTTPAATATTDHPHNRYHRYLSHHHHLHLHDHKPRLLLHRPPSKTPLHTLNASEVSTPLRTRSSSSSVYTTPSTFPSSAPVHTPIDAPNLHVIETGADDIETPKDPKDPIDSLNSRVNAALPTQDAAATLDAPSRSLPPSHGLQAQTDSFDSLANPAPLHAVSPHPQTQSRPALAQSPARSTASDEEAVKETQEETRTHDIYSDSISPTTSQYRQGEAEEDSERENSISIQAYKPEGHNFYEITDIHGAGVNGSEAGTIDSQTLALDQTRLRITYLVSTMVSPTANTPDDMAIGAAPGVGEFSKEAGLEASTAPVPLYGCDELANQEASEVGHYMKQCPKGWNHTEAPKKREKITQILYWQSEVTEIGDDAVFCGCSAGTTTPYDTNDDSGAGFTSMQPRSQASSEAGMPRLSTVASGVTTIGTSAAGPDRSSTASPSFSVTAPSTSLTSSLSSTPSPGPSSLRAARPCCSSCKKLLMPPRTVVFVSSSSDDFPWVQHAVDPNRSNSGFRRAIRAIRGMIGLSKRRKEKADQAQNGLLNPDVAKIANSGGGNALFFAVPDLTGVQLVGPSSPMPNQRKKNIPEAKVWDLWEKTNCSELREHVEKDEWALFFPVTDMYRSLRKGAEDLEPVSDKTAAEADADADVNVDEIINDDEDDDNNNEHAKERRKKREMAERLQRAQVLLEQHK